MCQQENGKIVNSLAIASSVRSGYDHYEKPLRRVRQRRRINMSFKNSLYCSTATILCVVALGCGQPVQEETAPAASETIMPQYQVDPFWPKPLPDAMLIGEIAGLAVDAQDHVWVFHRPGSLSEDELGAAQDPPVSLCCNPAPWIVEFDAEGNYLRGWGGPDEAYDWPEIEHGLFVDHENNVWLAGEDTNDHQVLKFTADGEFLLQIGQRGQTGGNAHTEFLGHPTDMEIDPETNEVFVADGYLNRRVIVFDATTGEYKRHWGAYGNEPQDFPAGTSYLAGRYRHAGPDGELLDSGFFPPIAPDRQDADTGEAFDPEGSPSQQFNIVHGLRLTDDGLVYVADRTNSRVQVFQRDGTYVDEVVIEKATMGEGSAWDVDVSPDEQQTFLYVADGTNQRVWIVQRATLEILGSFGRRGHGAGEFHWIHRLVVDSQGNLYTGEVNRGRRLQKWVLAEDNAATE